MPQISITFNGTVADLDDFVNQYNYSATIPNPTPQPAEGQPGRDTWTATIPNPETKVQFFQRKIKEFVYESVKAQRVTKASEAARKTEIEKTINF